MRRRKDGDLHISFERPIADGIEPGTVKLLDPFSKGSSMGKIEYRVDDKGITIDKLNVGKFTEGKNYITDYETVTKDMLTALRNEYGGLPIAWEPDAVEYQAVRDRHLEGVNSETIPAERNVNAALAELLGIKDRIVETQDRADLTEAERELIEAKEATGAVVKGATLGMKDGKRVIYYNGQTFDASTSPHEYLHAYVKNAAPEMKAELSKVMGLPDSSEAAWNAERFTSGRTGKKINAHERLAEYWESYLTNENAKIPSGVRALFDRLAAAMRQIFKNMGWKREDVPKGLNKIFDDMAAGRARIEGQQTSEEGHSEAQAANAGIDTAEADTTAQADTAEDIVPITRSEYAVSRYGSGGEWFRVDYAKAEAGGYDEKWLGNRTMEEAEKTYKRLYEAQKAKDAAAETAKAEADAAVKKYADYEEWLQADATAKSKAGDDYFQKLDNAGYAAVKEKYRSQYEKAKARLLDAEEGLFSVIDIPANPWPPNIRVTPLTSMVKMKKQPAYNAGKAGDRAKAADLIEGIMSGKTQREKIRALAEKYPDAILVAVHAEEAAGRNQIPLVLAKYIGGETGLEVADRIIQSEYAKRTGSDGWYRLANRAKFDGPVQSGREYILIDDVVARGGTLSDLRYYIEARGGVVVDLLSLSAGQFSTNIALSEKTRLALESKYGVESLQQFLNEVGLYGGEHRALTESEARLILGAPSLDEARDRIFTARRNRDEQILRREVQAPEGTSDQRGARYAGRSPGSLPEEINPGTPPEKTTEGGLFNVEETYNGELREVKSVSEAQNILNEIITRNIKSPNIFINTFTNIPAIITKNTISKMGSDKATNKSISPHIHAIAVANIDRLYENATIHITHPDQKNDVNIKQIHRFGTVMKYDGEYYPIKITVKESTKTTDKNRIYTIEAVDIEKIKKSAGLTLHPDEQGRSVQTADFYNSLEQLVKSFKQPSNSLSPNSPDESSANQAELDAAAEDGLFQLIEADADAAVENYKDADAWMVADMEAAAGDDFPVDDSWYDKWFDDKEAYHKMFSDAKERKATRKAAPVTTSSADDRFIQKMKSNENLSEFADSIGSAIYLAEKMPSREAEEDALLAKQLPGQFTIGRDKREHIKPSERQLKSMRTLINESPTQYRRVYTKLTGDPEFVEYSRKEVNDKPYVERAAAEAETKVLSIKQQSRLALKFEADDIRQAVRTGEITDDRLEKVIADDKLDIAELKNQIETTEQTYKTKLKKVNQDLREERDWGKNLSKAYVTLKKELTGRVHAKVGEIRAARRLLDEKKRLLKSIMKPAKLTIWHTEREQIREIQSLLYKGGTGKSIKFNGKSYPIEKFKKLVADGEIKLNTLTERQAERLTKKSMAELTIKELREIKETVADLRREGRANEITRRQKQKLVRVKKLERLFKGIVDKATPTSHAGKRIKAYNAAETEEEAQRVIRGNVVDAMGNFINMYSDEDLVFESLGEGAVEIENEHNNVLKNHGYNLEHNVETKFLIGHGEEHGSENFCLLNLPAFLFHTVLYLGDEQYRASRTRSGCQDNFFSALRYIFSRFLHENWYAFILFVWGDEPDG